MSHLNPQNPKTGVGLELPAGTSPATIEANRIASALYDMGCLEVRISGGKQSESHYVTAAFEKGVTLFELWLKVYRDGDGPVRFEMAHSTESLALVDRDIPGTWKDVVLYVADISGVGIPASVKMEAYTDTGWAPNFALLAVHAAKRWEKRLQYGAQLEMLSDLLVLDDEAMALADRFMDLLVESAGPSTKTQEAQREAPASAGRLKGLRTYPLEILRRLGLSQVIRLTTTGWVSAVSRARVVRGKGDGVRGKEDEKGYEACTVVNIGPKTESINPVILGAMDTLRTLRQQKPNISTGDIMRLMGWGFEDAAMAATLLRGMYPVEDEFVN